MTRPGTRRPDETRVLRDWRWARAWRAVGWLGVALTFALSLTPPALGGDTGHADKLVHCLGYATLMYWWSQIVVARRAGLAVAIVALGVLIEGLQGLTPDRQPDLLDALANATGVAIGWMTATLTPNLVARLAALPAYRA